MNEEKFIELTTKYLSNEATGEETKQIKSLLRQDEYNRLFNEISSKWNERKESETSNEFNIQRGLLKLSAKIRKYEPAFNFAEERKEKLFVFSPAFIRIAASIAFILIIASSALYLSGIFEKKIAPIAWNEKSTLMGEKSIVTLLDGTKITLNADSKLRYPMRFGEDLREVFLEGEAYFEVTHDASKPFIVHTGDVATIDLGTKFDISAFSGEKNISVSLIEGSVKVSANGNASPKGDVILEPSQQLIYNVENETSKIKLFDEQKATGWKDNILKFDGEPLANVFVKLERAYGVKFELTDKSYSNKKITTNFQNASLWSISEVIKKLTGLKYKTVKENNETKKIIFYKK